MAEITVDVTTTKDNTTRKIGSTRVSVGDSVRFMTHGEKVDIRFSVPPGSPFEGGEAEFGVQASGAVKKPAKDVGSRKYHYKAFGPEDPAGAGHKPSRPVRTGDIDIQKP